MCASALAAVYQAAAFKLLIRRRHGGPGNAELSRESALGRELRARQKVLPLDRSGQRRRELLVQRPRSLPPAAERIPQLHGQSHAKRRLIGLRHWPIIVPGTAPRKGRYRSTVRQPHANAWLIGPRR